MFLDLFLYFIVYSFIGWVMETTFASIRNRRFINRGFLIGPFTPIYGFGAVLIIQCSNWISGMFEDSFISLFVTVISSTLVVTVLEFITGLLLERVFDTKWWDYSSNAFNFKGYICLKYSLLWGILAFLLIQVVHPVILQIVELIPVTSKGKISTLLAMYFFVDTIKSITDTLDLRKVIINYSDLSVSKYKEKIIKYKRIFLAFPRLLMLNAGIINRDVRSILNGRINKIKTEIKNRLNA